MIVEITPLAEISFLQEQDYILEKWNAKEVIRFQNLVNTQVNQLAEKTIQGQVYRNSNIRFWLISRQTTLYYSTELKENILTLILFWNNQRDPKNLELLLKKLKH